MSYKYIPHTTADIQAMLDAVGVNAVDDLYSDVPREIIFDKEYDIPSEMSEAEVRRFVGGLAAKNVPMAIFAGAGSNNHY